jgi:hypothetical protein
MGRLVGLGLHLFTAKADHTACDTVEGADLTLALGLTFDALMAAQSLPRKHMPPLGRSSTRFVGTSRLIRRGRASAACRKSQGKNHGVLNKLLREASYVRVSPLEQKQQERETGEHRILQLFLLRPIPSDQNLAGPVPTFRDDQSK